MKHRIPFLVILCALVCFANASTAVCQQTRVYRGSIGGSHVQMQLNFDANKVSGSYFYDRIGEKLKLAGTINAQGALELTELGANNKPSAKIICKHKLGDDLVDSDCTWSRTDGTHQAFVTLTEQHSGFTGGLHLVPKTIIERARGISISYPQLASDKPLSSSATAFNQTVTTWINKTLKHVDPEPGPHTVYELNYNVLLGTNDLISFELSEYVDFGGAHPNNGYYAMTYDLVRNRELKIEDVLKADSDYKTAIAKFVVADIQRRDDIIEQQEAKSEGRQPRKQDEPIVSMDQLTEIWAFGITPKGLMVYFNFPNVIAVFDRTFISYSTLKDYLKADSPTARFQ
ncbi:MAG TPA: DUF3298 domain-containing protein [Pyrinomonadaceae bacterium]|jgi:hypothetical protein|nr:DUF3298 domain-containing protein [Pyrinomonadaceae bacterium]